jgi:hypothetical protein
MRKICTMSMLESFGSIVVGEAESIADRMRI